MPLYKNKLMNRFSPPPLYGKPKLWKEINGDRLDLELKLQIKLNFVNENTNGWSEGEQITYLNG